ncbi:TlpA family protein disulfide reductase [Winogradskyella aquimaris]|uniref:TlpA disulfide reductase family protein n=1 Tax=Winogradskyella aquimaris TaxID=864074 RepID=A0ABU5EIR5_9FLAO|nr:TlpA disulfide reductase family protein [Winogradskyella aquimaris]MDY2585874.1 TlpA disulfide reductase family protein [Winogradskyella aquimaris]
MKFNFNLHLLYLLGALWTIHSCGEPKNNSSIFIDIQGTIQPDSIQLLNYNNAEAITLKGSGSPFIFHQRQPVNDAFKLNIFKDENVLSKKVFLDGSDIKIKGKLTLDDFIIDTVLNSAIFYKQVQFQTTLDSLKSSKVNDTLINEILLEQIKENINHPLSFEISDYYIEKNKNYKSKLQPLQLILDQQSNDLKTHALSVHRTLNELLKEEYFDLSQFNFYDRQGNLSKVNLSHKGDYLIDFWFVQCPPCIRDHKKIAKYLDTLKDHNTELIGISIDTVEEKWLNYLNNNHYYWQNYRELGEDNDLVDAMNVWEFPTYILVDNNGVVKTKFYSFEEIANYFN